jgi:2-dehydro-3-deoxyphosphogluconate aldolase/(4S)-4-hydroxy-2-oxoglutarate aldolase
MNPCQFLEIVRSTGVIAILRASDSQRLIQAADALLVGGVRCIEVTLTTPGALAVIEQARAKYAQGEVFFGAGSVLDAESARLAIFAGAQFIVSPSFNPKVIRLCHRYSIPVFPGAYTPTEIVSAWECGADMVKVFPASLGGPEWIRALKAPLPQIELVPVGGVDLSNAADFIRAGAAALGVGSSLVNDKLLKEENAAAQIEARARGFIEAVRQGRA